MITRKLHCNCGGFVQEGVFVHADTCNRPRPRARVLLDDSGKLQMNCECGAPMPVRDTGHQGVGVTRCKECPAVYDYSCWEIVPTGPLTARGVRMHKVEAFRRGAA